MNLLQALAQAIVDFMDQSPPLVWALLAIVLANIPVIALHEAGHALAARRLLDVDVDLAVGSIGRLADLQLGRVRARVSALGPYGGAGGSVQFDHGRATARDVLLIALAGPAASLGGLLVTAWLLSFASSTGVAHALLWAATLGGAIGVLNLIPFRYRERRDGPFHLTDGRLALDALAAMRGR